MTKRYKRPFDLTILITAHIFLLPIVLGVWIFVPILIRVSDKGPVFFRQQRAGKNGIPFEILKFRTMTVDSNGMGSPWTSDRDARITPIGRLLRKTAIDEFPSLLSIWKGDMSLVGPRALDVREQHLLERQLPGFDNRLKVLPGLTGLAQVYDKLDIATVKIQYDIEYINRMGMWLDLCLLFLSFKNTILAQWDRRGGKISLATEDQEDHKSLRH